MGTFSAELKKIGRKALLDKHLPEMREQAKRLAQEAMERLRNKAANEGRGGDIRVHLEVSLPHEKLKGRLLKMVQRNLPVDMHAWESSSGIGFQPCKPYARGCGKKNYNFFVWSTLDHCAHLDHNLEHLRRKKKWNIKIEAYEAILTFFNCTETGQNFGGSMYAKKDLPELPNVEGRMSLSSWCVLIDGLLRFASKHPMRILELHRRGNPAEVYASLLVNDSVNTDTKDRVANCKDCIEKALLKDPK